MRPNNQLTKQNIVVDPSPISLPFKVSGAHSTMQKKNNRGSDSAVAHDTFWGGEGGREFAGRKSGAFSLENKLKR